MADAEHKGRICQLDWDPQQEVLTAWDLGVGDSTSIWFFQPLFGGINVIDYYEASGVGVDHYAQVLHGKPYKLGVCIVPHDANVREWGSDGGRTRIEAMIKHGLSPKLAPAHHLMDGINAARITIRQARFDAKRCERGLDALRAYHAKYDESARTLTKLPVHDWSSHGADAFRSLAMGWREMRQPEAAKPKPDFTAPHERLTIDQLWAQNRRAGSDRRI